ncbi:uncharacterized protein [Panulirus ornatus]|uniref:uncharacterized protein n=1 Tax=Panulirus ornatus TaxID=150431 RepID=UPI003A84174A
MVLIRCIQDYFLLSMLSQVDPASNDSNVDALGTNVTDERMEAARMNMFGKLTQSSVGWHPDRLLCRRFNVPNPYPESSHVGVYKTKRQKFSIFNLLTAAVEDTAGLQQTTSLSEEKEGKTDDKNSDVEPESETFGLKVSVDGPPTMDLFKAIFQDSDSDSCSDNESEKTTKDITKEEELCDKDPPLVKLNTSDTVASPSSVMKDVTGSRTDCEDRSTADADDLKDSRSAKDTAEDATERNRPDQQRIRISRFEPNEDISTCRYEGLPKPVFIQRKKDTVASEVVPTKGIFANIDFEALNSYRQTNVSADPDHATTAEKAEESISKSSQVDSDSSVDSENEYGPPVPTHLKNRIQMIRSPPRTKPAVIQNLQGSKTPNGLKRSQNVKVLRNTNIKTKPNSKRRKKRKIRKLRSIRKENQRKALVGRIVAAVTLTHLRVIDVESINSFIKKVDRLFFLHLSLPP